MKVLLIPANFHMAQGQIARFIVSSCSKIDFYFFGAHEIRLRSEEFLRLVRGVDVVHWLMNLAYVNIPKNLKEEALKKPTVASLYHICPGEEIKLEVASQADVIHTISMEWLNYVRARTRTPAYLAYGGTDKGLFEKNRRMPRPREPFRLGVLAFSTKLDDRKRNDILLEALNLLKKEVNFEIVTQGLVGPVLRPFLKELQINLRDQGLTRWKDAWKVYGRIDCYVCSSEIEGGPSPLLEALASGVPVVSTAVGVAPEILAWGGGILCPVNNASALTEALTRMTLDRQFYRKCQKEAPLVFDRFIYEKLAFQYERLYQEAIRQWTQRHNKVFFTSPNSGISPTKQRTIELKFNSMREALECQKNGNRHGLAFYLIVKVLFSFPIPFRRRAAAFYGWFKHWLASWPMIGRLIKFLPYSLQIKGN